MNKLDIQEAFLEFISKNFMVDREEIALEKSMIDEGIIDSFGLIEITIFLEETFMISIKEQDMIRDNFGSVVKIVDFIERKLVN